MKNRLLILLCAMLCVSSLVAGDHDYDGTTFIISSNVDLPVYVHYGGSKWTITSYQYTIYTRIPNATITDAHGNNCMYTHSYDQHSGSNGSYVHHYYKITGVYSSSSSSNNSSYSGGSSYSNNSNASEIGAQLGNAMAQMGAMEQVYEHYHAGGFQLASTISNLWGENLELRFRYGSSRIGGDVNVMIGHDWLNQIDGILWNIGLGLYFGGRPNNLYLWDVDLGLKVGHGNNPNKETATLVLDVSTTHFIGPKHIIGLTAGVAIGGDGIGIPRFVWDVRGGFVIYFLQWDWI